MGDADRQRGRRGVERNGGSLGASGLPCERRGALKRRRAGGTAQGSETTPGRRFWPKRRPEERRGRTFREQPGERGGQRAAADEGSAGCGTSADAGDGSAEGTFRHARTCRRSPSLFSVRDSSVFPRRCVTRKTTKENARLLPLTSGQDAVSVRYEVPTNDITQGADHVPF